MAKGNVGKLVMAIDGDSSSTEKEPMKNQQESKDSLVTVRLRVKAS